MTPEDVAFIHGLLAGLSVAALMVLTFTVEVLL